MDRHGNYNNETLFEEISGAIKVDLMRSVPLQIFALFLLVDSSQTAGAL